MYINEKNLAKLEKEIEKAEGRATARTITAEDMISACKKVERKLDIHKVDLIGVEVSVDLNAETLPHAYKWRAESTQFGAVYKKGGWELISVQRDYLRPNGHEFHVRLTEQAEKAVLKRNSCF